MSATLHVSPSKRIKNPARHPIDALVPILHQLEALGTPRETCLACGCLCLVNERCPGCLSRALDRAAAVGGKPA